MGGVGASGSTLGTILCSAASALVSADRPVASTSVGFYIWCQRADLVFHRDDVSVKAMINSNLGDLQTLLLLFGEEGGRRRGL